MWVEPVLNANCTIFSMMLCAWVLGTVLGICWHLFCSMFGGTVKEMTDVFEE